MGKIKLEDIQKQLEELNWKVLSEKYENLNTLMEFECAEGHQITSTWKNLRNRIVCPICNKQIYNQSSDIVIQKKDGVKRTLALDQATHKTGFSIFDNSELVNFGIIETKSSIPIKRYIELRNWLVGMIKNWQIDYMGFEGIQLQDNLAGGKSVGVTTFETLARLQGVLMITAFDLNIPFEICHTAVWRQFCGVKGRTRQDKKRSMQLLAKQWYDVTVSEDEADAIGIGRYISNEFAQEEIESWE